MNLLTWKLIFTSLIIVGCGKFESTKDLSSEELESLRVESGMIQLFGTSGINRPRVVGQITTNRDESTQGFILSTNVTNYRPRFSIVAPPSHGMLSINSPSGLYTYTPDGGFVGSDSMTYRIRLNGASLDVEVRLLVAERAPASEPVLPPDPAPIPDPQPDPVEPPPVVEPPAPMPPPIPDPIPDPQPDPVEPPPQPEPPAPMPPPQPEPPVPVPDPNPPAPVGQDLYELRDLPEFVQDIQWAEQPRSVRTMITSDQPAMNISDNDVFISCERGVTIGGMSISGSRVRIENCIITPGSLDLRGATDVTLYNVLAIDRSGTGNRWTSPNGGPQRVSVVRSTIAAATGGWAIYTAPGQGTRDIIVAASHIENGSEGYQTVRLQGVENFVAIDSVFNSVNPDSNGFRIHFESRDFFLLDTAVFGAFHISAGVSQGVIYDYGLQNGVFRNVDRSNSGRTGMCWHVLNDTINVGLENEICRASDNDVEFNANAGSDL